MRMQGRAAIRRTPVVPILHQRAPWGISTACSWRDGRHSTGNWEIGLEARSASPVIACRMSHRLALKTFQSNSTVAKAMNSPTRSPRNAAATWRWVSSTEDTPSVTVLLILPSTLSHPPRNPLAGCSSRGTDMAPRIHRHACDHPCRLRCRGAGRKNRGMAGLRRSMFGVRCAMEMRTGTSAWCFEKHPGPGKGSRLQPLHR